ncbi:dihydrofolate reductase family protein [Paracoccus sp. 11-3]|uniref:Dihydrofolate reductase family protein n=1 Tax=Paracoccus amoyensis TaxID=2760093 RepID=A0A926GF77_9RHOB|nr:dihydrofolate reductase family protein [Paracoccus amoyensis]MBC9247471.1 dihydrofolate reductase family protein [Paracoccus amoyensis]
MNAAPLFVQISVSLDDRIEDAKKAIDWMTEDRSVDRLHTETLESIAGMIFGRKAHETIASFWMDAAAGRMEMDADLKRQSELMAALPKYVLSHGPYQTDWNNSRVIRLDDVARIRAEAEKPIAAFAGAGAIQSLLAQGLVDDVRLIRYPVVLGSGTPLFANDGVRRGFVSIDATDFKSGARLERYRPMT